MIFTRFSDIFFLRVLFILCVRVCVNVSCKVFHYKDANDDDDYDQIIFFSRMVVIALSSHPLLEHFHMNVVVVDDDNGLMMEKFSFS